MKRTKIVMVLAGIIFVAAVAAYFFLSNPSSDDAMIEKNDIQQSSETSFSELITEQAPVEDNSIWPTDDFSSRVTKKSFGMYISPSRSPVQPERFTGYHTGVDVEFDDVESSVPVIAIGDGEIVQSQWVSGYGGLIVLRTFINDEELHVIYGHLDPSSMTKQTAVKRGDQLANLGAGYSRDTDGERKHLHFGIRRGSADIRGYVQSELELVGWRDPIPFLEQLNTQWEDGQKLE